MKGIKVCGDCALYDWKHHKCPVCSDEGKATDPFYADCPLPDVEEVKQGKWIKQNDVAFELCGVDYFKCSICNIECQTEYNFCPHCGARMDGDSK